MNSLSLPHFRSSDADPGATLKSFNEYTEQIDLLAQLAFRKADGSAYTPSDNEKKALLQLKGGRDMKSLLTFTGNVLSTDTYEQALEKVRNALKARTNSVVQRNMLLTNYPQGRKSFEKWSQEICEAAQLIDYNDYNWKTAAVDAMNVKTSTSFLREKALQDNSSYESLLKLGIAKEQSAKGATLLENAQGSGMKVKVEEEVRRLKSENKKLRRKTKVKYDDDSVCSRCGLETCKRGTKCPANGQTCSKCNKKNHFSRVCKSQKATKPPKGVTFGNVSTSDSSDNDSAEEFGCILVGKLESKAISAKVKVGGIDTDINRSCDSMLELCTDTGVRKSLINLPDWRKIRNQCKLVKTSKAFRPYGTPFHLKILGKARTVMIAENGAQIQTWSYIHQSEKEKSLLGEEDARRLGIVMINLKGATKEEIPAENHSSQSIQDDNDIDYEVPVRAIAYNRKSPVISEGIVSGGETQAEIDVNMENLKGKYHTLFSDKTGKFKGSPIPIQTLPETVPIIQPPRRIPLQYIERTKVEIEKMLSEDIIEGPIEMEEPGTFLSNLVIDNKKGNSDQLRITLDCQDVNKYIYATHEPMPTVDELRHLLNGSDRFSTLDLTSCYHQFEIEKSARKLFAFRTPWGIYQYKRMVQGTSPASSEIHKRIREIIKKCKNCIHIKDDIVVHGKGGKHDQALEKVLQTLQSNGVTLRPPKCILGKQQIKWFGYIFNKDGMSTDPEKCRIIQDWPQPTSKKEVKSFLQTVQFNAKFLGGEPGEPLYSDLTSPLKIMAKKHARFVWGKKQDDAFQDLKRRLCSDKVMVPYCADGRKTRLYVDSSEKGTQHTVAQLHNIGNEDCWRTVNHTSRAWTDTEQRYSQMERESNGILSGMMMNKMYTLGTHIEVVNDHKPLLPMYQCKGKKGNLRVDRHRFKLLPFDYTVVYEPGETSPCDYGSRHPPKQNFSAQQIEDWGIETGNEILVNRVLEESIPTAMGIDRIKAETAKDKVLTNVISLIGKHNRCDIPDFKDVFQELWQYNGILMRGDKIVIPDSLHADAVALAHEGHQYIDKTLKLLRETCWFPGMRKMVDAYITSCIACNSSQTHNPPVPLELNLLPERAWQKLHFDFKGPIANKYYMHIVIDQYSKFPEVDLLTSTSFEKVRPALDRVLATHGIPEVVSTDNGPPYTSHEFEAYAKEWGFKLKPVSPKDPQCNGFVENFVKSICKLIHTACAEGKDPKAELYKFLLQYRATPHTTTGRSPSE